MEEDAVLVGRQTELAAIARMLSASGASAAALEVLGEPGIGKTRLLAELSGQAVEQGRLVLEGRAAEFEGTLPFAIFVDALDDYLGTVEPRRIERLGDEPAGHLRAIFPSLAAAAEGQGPLQEERFRSYRAVRLLLETVASRRPLLLVLDDAHWCDEASLELLSHLLRHRPRGEVLIAFAHRPRQLAQRLAPALARAISGGADERLELTALSPKRRTACWATAGRRPRATSSTGKAGATPSTWASSPGPRGAVHARARLRPLSRARCPGQSRPPSTRSFTS